MENKELIQHESNGKAIGRDTTSAGLSQSRTPLTDKIVNQQEDLTSKQKRRRTRCAPKRFSLVGNTKIKQPARPDPAGSRVPDQLKTRQEGTTGDCHTSDAGRERSPGSFTRLRQACLDTRLIVIPRSGFKTAGRMTDVDPDRWKPMRLSLIYATQLTSTRPTQAI